MLKYMVKLAHLTTFQVDDRHSCHLSSRLKPFTRSVCVNNLSLSPSCRTSLRKLKRKKTTRNKLEFRSELLFQGRKMDKSTYILKGSIEGGQRIWIIFPFLKKDYKLGTSFLSIYKNEIKD